MKEKMTTLSYIYMAESQFKSVRWNWGANERDLSHMVLEPIFLSLTVLSGTRYQKASRNHLNRGPKSRGALSWYNAPAKSQLRYHCRLYFSLFVGHFDIKVGKSLEDIVRKEAFHSCPLSCPQLSNCRRILRTVNGL